MTALGDLLAVLACLDMRASLAGLTDLRRLFLTIRPAIRMRRLHIIDFAGSPALTERRVSV
jgi:hypothetical protein